MELLDGKRLADEIKAEIAAEVEAIKKNGGNYELPPFLTIQISNLDFMVIILYGTKLTFVSLVHL